MNTSVVPGVKISTRVLLSMLLVVLSTYVYTLFLPSGTYLSYEKDYEVRTQFLPYQKYFTSIGVLEVPLDYYTIWTKYIGTQTPPHRDITHLYAVGFGLVLCLWAILATYLPQFWYVLAQGALACCLYACNLQHLQLFGRVDNYFYLIFFPLFVVSFYINRYKRPYSFPLRVLIFVSMFALLALVVATYSTVANPFLVFVYQSYYVQLCIGVLFCLIVGHELAYLILRVCSSAGFGNSLGQFVLISVLYVSYLGLFFLSNIGYLSWEMKYVDEFVLLGGAICVGFVGIKGWAHHYAHIVSPSLLQINYLVMALMTCLLVLMLRVHSNDSALEVIEDAVLFGHLGFGVGFIVHVLSKYRHALSRNVSVWKVVYARAGDNAFLSVRIAGLIIMFICYSLSDGALYNHAIAGAYLQEATLAQIDKIAPLREEYLKMAALFGYQGHSANYSLGQYATEKNELHKAVTYYRAASSKHPTPHAFMNLSHVLERLELFELSKEVLQKGVEHFPSYKLLANNLGLYYLKEKHLDSAHYFLRHAKDFGNSNLLVICSEDSVETHALSVVDKTNVWAYALDQATSSSTSLDTLAQGPYVLYYVHNYLLLLLQNDPERLIREVQNLKSQYTDPWLVHDMYRLEAFAHYMCGHTVSALRILKQLAYDHRTHRGFYYYVLGVWTLLEGASAEAQVFFTTAYQAGYLSAKPLAEKLLKHLPSSLKIRQAKQLFDTTSTSMRIDSLLLAVETGTYPQIWQQASTNLRESIRVHIGKYLLEQEKFAEVEQWLQDYNFVDTVWKEKAQLLRAEAAYASIPAAAPLQEALAPLEEALPHKHYFTVPTDSTQATIWKKEIEEHAFQVHFTIRSAERLRIAGYELLAYDLLLRATEIHPYSVTLHKAYAWHCLQLGLDNYAAQTLLDIKHTVSKEKWKKIHEDYILFQRAWEEKEKIWE